MIATFVWYMHMRLTDVCLRLSCQKEKSGNREFDYPQQTFFWLVFVTSTEEYVQGSCLRFYSFDWQRLCEIERSRIASMGDEGERISHT
jgi:hypothetical protein